MNSEVCVEADFHEYTTPPHKDTKTLENIKSFSFLYLLQTTQRMQLSIFPTSVGPNFTSFTRKHLFFKHSLHNDLYFLYAEDKLFQILKSEIAGSSAAVNVSLSTVASSSK